MRIKRGIMHTQTKSCKICIHIFETAFFFGKRRKDNKQGWYIRILTPWKIFSICKPA